MGCPRIPQMNYGDFSNVIYLKSTNKRIPIAGTIELTMRCNLYCTHCYCFADRNKKELSTRQWKDIVDQTADSGCLWLLITGGEPLLRSDFLEIYLHAKQNGMIVSLFTNGVLINEEIAKTLKENPPFKLEITVYGSDDVVYERICGIQNSFTKLMEGLALLNRYNVPYQLKTLVTKQNINDFQNIMSFIRSSTEYRFDGLLSPKINGDKSSIDTRLDIPEIVNLEASDKKVKTAWKDVIQKFGIQLDENTDALVCSVGINNFNISPYGQLQLCGMLQEPSYNLIPGSFREGWEKLEEMRNDFPKVDKSCWGCEEAVFCESCPGWSWLEHKNYSQPSEFLCNIAKKRSEVYL